MSISQDVQKLEPGSVIETFELDLTTLGGSIMRFHRHLESGSIWWQGKEYSPYPIKTDGFALTNDKPPQPTLQVSNIKSLISSLCIQYGDLVGAKLTRHRTLLTYLDAINFTNGVNLLTNGFLRDDVAGWTLQGSGTFTWVTDGQARLSGTTSTKRAYQDIPVTPGVQYLAKVRIISKIASASVVLYDGANTTTPLAAGMGTAGITNTVIVTPTQSTVRFAIEAGASSEILVSLLEFHEYVGNPSADSTEEFTPEVWYIERKQAENNDSVTFELVSALDLNGVMLPRRQIIPNYCLWLSLDGYRGANCGYTGPAVAKADGTPTTVMSEDACGGKLSDCRLRVWPNNVLNFGGFPAAGLMRY